jgi:hypothetical protein
MTCVYINILHAKQLRSITQLMISINSNEKNYVNENYPMNKHYQLTFDD